MPTSSSHRSVLEVFQEPPSISSFTPLSEHESQTPSSFYSDPPVLHHHSLGTQLIISEYDDFSSSPLSKLADSITTNNAFTNGDTNHEMPDEVLVEGVDIWVTSEKFVLYRPALHIGVSIPYPRISLHAIQSHASVSSTSGPLQGLYMQLDTSDGFDDHNSADTVAVTIVPPQTSTDSHSNPAPEAQLPSQEPFVDVPQADNTPVQTLFVALSTCANLHPDPPSPGLGDVMNDGQSLGSHIYQSTDAEGGVIDGLPPPMPGSGGWITAENMGDYFDEEGNWRGEALGAGAGSIRTREDVDVDGGTMGEDGGNGADEEEEAKRRRVE